MQPNNFFALEQVIDRQPLIVTPQTPLIEVIGLMQQWGNSCTFSNNRETPHISMTEDSLAFSDNSCVLIVEDRKLRGIFTERDLVRLIAAELNIATVTVAEVMTRDIVTISQTESDNLFKAIGLLRQHRIRHLPAIDSQGNLMGLISAKNLRQKLQPINLMKWRTVSEVMRTKVVYASPHDSVKQIARLMAANSISCVAIAEKIFDPENEASLVRPIGIITERDIVQFQNLNLNLAQPARNLMSTPLFLVNPEDSLWKIQQQMQQRKVRRLLVKGTAGELVGIVTQTSLLEVFDPSEMYGIIEMLQQQVCRLEIEYSQLLENQTTDLENQVEERTSELTKVNQQLQLEIDRRKHSEQKFRAIFDKSFQFIGLLEPNGNVIEANKTALDFVGLTPADVRGKPFWLTPWWSMSSEIQQLIKQAIERSAKGEFVRFEVEHPGTEDRVVTVDFSLTPIKDETGQVVLLIPEGRNISDRKQAELERRKFVSLADNSSEFIGMCDLNFVPFYVNEAGKQLIGLDNVKKYSEISIGDFFFPEDRDFIFNKFFPQVLRQGQGEVEIRFRHFQTGEALWMIYSVHTIEENGRSIAFATLSRDITKRKKAEAALRQSEQKFKAIFDRVFQFVGLMKVDGTLIEANQTALDFAGLTLEEVANKPFWEARWWTISQETQKQLKDAIAKAALGEFIRYEVDVLGIEDRIATIDFSLKPIKDETGKVVMLIPEGRDITQSKQSGAKIREQAALLDVATDAILVCGLDDRLLYWNQGAEKIYGWTAAEALKGNANELLYPQSSDKLAEIQQAVLTKGKWQGEIDLVTKAGDKIMVKSRWTLVKDAENSPQSYLIVDTDITEQKQLEAQFLRTQRLESLGTLAGGIAHDLNNILAPILGFAKLLPLKLPDADEQTKGFFRIMETNARRGTALVKQILTFAQGLEGDRGTIQIRHLILEVRQVVKETFPKNIELEIDIAKNLWAIDADATQIHQVLMNLVVNARDAMINGGKLQITAVNFVVDADFARMHLDAREGNYILIDVTDTGVGIPPVILDRIFEPFFTTKEVGHGTGLGLSTTIGIVRSHGGFIDVYSEIQRGTQFRVFLPASETAATATSEDTPILQGNDELILVVDDEPSILEVTKATLQTFNYQVLTAKDGMEAIAVYANKQQEIGLIIIDMMMPNMDGKTAIRTLKQINPEVKIIAVSGLVSHREILLEINDRITIFMTKPYSNEDLLKSVYQLINS